MMQQFKHSAARLKIFPIAVITKHQLTYYQYMEQINKQYKEYAISSNCFKQVASIEDVRGRVFSECVVLDDAVEIDNYFEIYDSVQRRIK